MPPMAQRHFLPATFGDGLPFTDMPAYRQQRRRYDARASDESEMHASFEAMIAAIAGDMP